VATSKALSELFGLTAEGAIPYVVSMTRNQADSP
jgi:hypothetical protein